MTKELTRGEWDRLKHQFHKKRLTEKFEIDQYDMDRLLAMALRGLEVSDIKQDAIVETPPEPLIITRFLDGSLSPIPPEQTPPASAWLREEIERILDAELFIGQYDAEYGIGGKRAVADAILALRQKPVGDGGLSRIKAQPAREDVGGSIKNLNRWAESLDNETARFADFLAVDIRKAARLIKHLEAELVEAKLALKTIAEFPISDHTNQDAINMKQIAQAIREQS